MQQINSYPALLAGTTTQGIRRLTEPERLAYHDRIISLSAKTQSETEQLWKTVGPDEDVQRSMQELLQTKETYNAFTKKVDA